jgi:cell wall-associated NlpC family hydrolase
MKRQLMRVTLGTMLAGKKVGSVYQVELTRNQNAYIACRDLDRLSDDLTVKRAESLVRKNLVDKMKIAIGSPYLWGGRSIWDPSVGLLTGVDCSSLINLVYRSQGINLPRNSLSQFLFAKKIDCGKKLRPGDLVFVSKKKNPMQGISHVMMYAHNNKFVEASAHASRLRTKANRLNNLRTRIVSDKHLFGKSYTQLASGEKIMKGSRRQEYVFFASPLATSFKGDV